MPVKFNQKCYQSGKDSFQAGARRSRHGGRPSNPHILCIFYSITEKYL
jgi:hypothetical protein